MIECNEHINFGQPALKGRRLTVFDIVTKIYYEENAALALSDYDITLSDAKDALIYCKELTCQSDKNLVKFCDGCLLRTINEGWNFNLDEYTELENIDKTKITISKKNDVIFMGSLKELEDAEFGIVTWLIAAHELKIIMNHNE